jgi:hypothetical protein|tara:strand:- start:21 stop:512 length:492 start_codon:yes stop_codon:yes gene_type:complete
MKLELKNIKHTEWASQETHCFQASLYVDGKAVAIIGNDGQGGCDYEYDHPKCKVDYRATMKAVHAYFKALPNEPSEWSEDGFPQQLEYWCAEQINDWLSAKELKRKFKSHVVYQLKGTGALYQTKYHPTVTKGEWVVDRKEAHTRRILNDMPFDEALTLWRAS